MKTLKNIPKIWNKYLLVIFFLLYAAWFSNDVKATVINITAQDHSFIPANAIATVGDTIRWIWSGPGPYTTTCDGIYPGTSLPEGAASWDVLLDNENPSFVYKITIPGTYNYLSKISPTIEGRIIAEIPLPIELTDFVATTIKNEVILDWSTSGELNNDRFEIQRVELNNFGDNDPNSLFFITIGFLQGQGTSNQIHNYKFIDRNLPTGIYLYRLKQIDFNGNFVYHLLDDEVEISAPDKFKVSQNYPNPFNPTTKINYELPISAIVTISLFDISGKEIKELVNEYISAGYQTIEIDGSLLSSGVYYYKIIFNNDGNSQSVIKKMLLIK